MTWAAELRHNSAAVLVLRDAFSGAQATEGLKPAVINRLAKELRELQQRPEEGIRVRASGRLGKPRPAVSAGFCISAPACLLGRAGGCQRGQHCGRAGGL
jgi:hypothetical protein